MEYITYLIIFALGLWVGYRVQDIIMKATFMKMLEEAGVTDKDMEKFVRHWKPKMEPATEDDLEVIHVKIEQHGSALYMFRKDNDQFLGQGNTREELIDILGKKLNNVRLLISKDDGADFIGGHFNVVDGKVKTAE